jgi:hypothetical protein
VSEMAGGELLVVATIRDELAPGLEAIRVELGRVAVAQERVAATSTQASAGLTREGVAAERTTTQAARGRPGRPPTPLADSASSGIQVPKTAAAIASRSPASVYAAAKFESAITRVQTQAGASASEVARLRGELLKLAPQVGTSRTSSPSRCTTSSRLGSAARRRSSLSPRPRTAPRSATRTSRTPPRR